MTDDAEYLKELINLPYGEAKRRMIVDKKIKLPARASRYQSMRRWLVTVYNSASPKCAEYHMEHSTKRKAEAAAIDLFLMTNPDKCHVHVWAKVCSDD